MEQRIDNSKVGRWSTVTFKPTRRNKVRLSRLIRHQLTGLSLLYSLCKQIINGNSLISKLLHWSFHISRMDNPKTWEEIVSQKIQLRDQALQDYLVNDIDQRIPIVANVDRRSRLASDPIVQEITDIPSVPDLLKLLSQGKYTAEDVVTAYIKR
jgi:hypothetical protein